MTRGGRARREDEIRDATHKNEARRRPSPVRKSVLPFDAKGNGPFFRNMAALPGLKTMIVKTIAFDLDGTLIESASLVGELLNSMRLEKGLAPLGPDCYRVWSSRGGNYLVGHALEAGPEAVGALVDEFRRRYHALPTPMESVFPGARELLGRLTDAGCVLAICSNKPRRLCHKLLEETDLIGFFKTIVGGDTLDKSKPDPAPLRHALSRSGGVPETALMIGDSAVDQKTADAADVRFAFFTGGYDDGVDRAKAYRVFDALGEVASILEPSQLGTTPAFERPRQGFGLDRGLAEQTKSA
jgi:phosphoglycolate phosphatase